MLRAIYKCSLGSLTSLSAHARDILVFQRFISCLTFYSSTFRRFTYEISLLLTVPSPKQTLIRYLDMTSTYTNTIRTVGSHIEVLRIKRIEGHVA